LYTTPRSITKLTRVSPALPRGGTAKRECQYGNGCLQVQLAIAKSVLIISVDVAKTHLFPAVHGAIEA